MKKIAAAVAVIAYCIAAGGEISLAEKIALAKKMADAAAAGKEESGLVVNGGFDFSKMLEKYGSEIAQSDKTALPAPSEPETAPEPDLPQLSPAPATASDVKVVKTPQKSGDADSKKFWQTLKSRTGRKSRKNRTIKLRAIQIKRQKNPPMLNREGIASYCRTKFL